MSTSSREFVVKEGLRFERHDVRSNYYAEFNVKEGWQQYLSEQLSREIDRQILKDLQIVNEFLSERRLEPEKITQRKLQDMILTWRFQF